MNRTFNTVENDSKNRSDWGKLELNLCTLYTGALRVLNISWSKADCPCNCYYAAPICWPIMVYNRVQSKFLKQGNHI